MRRCAALPILGCVVGVLLIGGFCDSFKNGGKVAWSVPSFAEARAAHRPSDARLLDRNGEVLHELRVDLRRRRLEWTPIGATSPALLAAVIAGEDRRFHSHAGVDWLATAHAAGTWLVGGHPRGASTISMQVAALLDRRLSRPGRARSLGEKVAQMRAARALERRWSKNEILEAYLNLATYRGELQGVSAVSSMLFGKSPHGLDEAEAAVLAALLRAPNAAPAGVLRRARAVRSALDAADGEQGLAAAVGRSTASAHVAAPRIEWAPHAARRLLDRDDPRDVVSTLDLGVQRIAVEALRRHVLAIRDRNVADAAVLVADNAGGEVLAYVGSSGDLSLAPEVDGIRARRQAGSALKPFLYALAFDLRIVHPASLLDDSPLEIAAAAGLYRPSNYDRRFTGLVSARTALAGSLNVPAVRTLQLLGAERFVRQLRRLGFASVGESGDFYGPSLALGSADVTLWELTNAFRALAAGGTWSPLHLLPGEPPGPAERVSSSEAAFLVTDILSDRQSRSATFGPESALDTRFWSAVKTGTSKDMRDNWCIGSSERYTVGVWVGNFSGEPMRGVSGVSGAAPIWNDVLSWLHRDEPSRAPAPPAGVVSAPVSFANRAEADRREWFLRDTEPADSRAVLARSPAILTPTDGSVIAVDPDIADARQRLPFMARSGEAGARWRLDGRDFGPAEGTRLWRPSGGTHLLQLIDADERVLDQARFEVRAPRRPDSRGTNVSSHRARTLP